ncbi:MAG TPA: prepilin-type N-terminal cleavage/methylation domain-containing protein, partial [Candidatus Binatia bacterium]|nr:prepilin-type N-terminal cleavage/methylation domain-containing protein [Candidatus Binatia bacterium]
TAAGRSYPARRATSFHAFTLIELLVVIGIIALLAGLVVGGTRYAGSKMKESRIRAELNALATAIEAYNAKFGHYPPDNVVRRTPVVVVNSVSNSLFTS